MTRRALALLMLLCCGMAEVVSANQARGAAGGGQAAPAVIEVDIALTASRLADNVRAAMVQEAERIWRPYRIALRWRAGTAGNVETAHLRVVVVMQAESVEPSLRRTTVAELLPHAGDRAAIIVSVSAAQGTLREAAQAAPGTPAGADEQLGLILGRALAHEIGHFVLGTHTHAPTGLMRALIPASDLAGARADVFVLDDSARRWIEARRQNAQGDPLPWLRAGGFSYR